MTSSGTSAAGTIKLASAIELEWVEDLIPRLKDVNVKRLCGLPEPKEDGKVLGKREEREEESKEAAGLSKEEKMRELRERYMKRQKKK